MSQNFQHKSKLGSATFTIFLNKIHVDIIWAISKLNILKNKCIFLFFYWFFFKTIFESFYLIDACANSQVPAYSPSLLTFLLIFQKWENRLFAPGMGPTRTLGRHTPNIKCHMQKKFHWIRGQFFCRELSGKKTSPPFHTPEPEPLPV